MTDLFADESNLEAFLERSMLFDRVRKESHRSLRYGSRPRPEHQQSAKLHCLYGQPILNVGRLRSSRTYPYACSRVYDLRLHTERTKWGPFMDDDTDRVDWEKLEAIVVTLGFNMKARKLTSTTFVDCAPFAGAWPKSQVSAPKPDISSLESRDPYGVTGLWYRVSAKHDSIRMGQLTKSRLFVFSITTTFSPTTFPWST